MNENPWNVDNMARAQRERIQEEMRQIRLEQAAERAQVRIPRLPRLIRVVVQWWLNGQEKRAARVAQQRPARRVHSRRHAHG